LIGHDHPNKPANGERMISQSVGGLAIRSCALQSLARDRTQDRTPLLLIARWNNGTLLTTGQEPRSGQGGQKTKRGL
jgi:hypothetical protein